MGNKWRMRASHKPSYPADDRIPKHALQGPIHYLEPGCYLTDTYLEHTDNKIGEGLRKILKKSHTKRQRRYNKKLERLVENE